VLGKQKDLAGITESKKAAWQAKEVEQIGDLVRISKIM
jgi:hypothetical protein